MGRRWRTVGRMREDSRSMPRDMTYNPRHHALPSPPFPSLPLPSPPFPTLPLPSPPFPSPFSSPGCQGPRSHPSCCSPPCGVEGAVGLGLG